MFHQIYQFSPYYDPKLWSYIFSIYDTTRPRRMFLSMFLRGSCRGSWLSKLFSRRGLSKHISCLISPELFISKCHKVLVHVFSYSQVVITPPSHDLSIVLYPMARLCCNGQRLRLSGHTHVYRVHCCNRFIVERCILKTYTGPTEPGMLQLLLFYI